MTRDANRLNNPSNWFRMISEAVFFLRHMAQPWPWEMIAEQRDTVHRKHTEDLDAGICRLLWIKIIDELASRLLQQENRVMRQIADQADRLIPGRQHEACMSSSVPGGNHSVYTR
jgi:hypothetical protein